MAGHGGGGGGHGGGGGGGGASKGRLAGIMGNGCLRYLFLYIIGLVLILGFLGASALGLFRRLPIQLPSLPAASGNSTVASASVASAPTTAPAAPAAAAPAVAAAPAAAPPAGQAAGTGSTGSQSTGGGSSSTAPGMAQLASVPLMGTQGVTIIPYIVPAFYVVQPADTLAIIADKYNTTSAYIRSYNGLISDDLKVGQILYLPPPVYNPVPGTGRNAHP